MQAIKWDPDNLADIKRKYISGRMSEESYAVLIGAKPDSELMQKRAEYLAKKGN